MNQSYKPYVFGLIIVLNRINFIIDFIQSYGTWVFFFSVNSAQYFDNKFVDFDQICSCVEIDNFLL